MLYLAIMVGLVVTTYMLQLAVGLGKSAQRGDRLLREYHEAHGRYYQDEWDEEFERRWKWKEEPVEDENILDRS